MIDLAIPIGSGGCLAAQTPLALHKVTYHSMEGRKALQFQPNYLLSRISPETVKILCNLDTNLQGDTSGCSLGFVYINIKVAF